MTRLTVADLQEALGVTADGKFGPVSKAALRKRLTNTAAPRLNPSDFTAFASLMGADVRIVKAVNKVEAPRGAYDRQGLLTLLYERHKFRAHTVPPGRFNSAFPYLSGPAYGPGGYGSFAAQFDRFADACALDPQAAFEACSWGAFQVMGENWSGCGYASVLDMVFGLVEGEGAHLDSLRRFIAMKGLGDELRACKPGDPTSCVPFVRAYNGTGYASFGYHIKLAETALKM